MPGVSTKVSDQLQSQSPFDLLLTAATILLLVGLWRPFLCKTPIVVRALLEAPDPS